MGCLVGNNVMILSGVSLLVLGRMYDQVWGADT